MTKLRWLLLAALALVSAAALRLSGRPIMETARSLGVPDDGSLATAVLMVEGAQLILTALWLHPATSAPVRRMAAAGTIGCLLLSAAAGCTFYGPAGVVPALLYAWLVHILSRDLLSGTASREPAAAYVPNPQVVAMDEVVDQGTESADPVGWGPAATAREPEPLRAVPSQPRSTAKATPKGTEKQRLRARARELGVTQSGKSMPDLRRDVESAERERAGSEGATRAEATA